MRLSYVMIGVFLVGCGSDGETGGSETQGTVVEVRTGGQHVCARLASGAVRCFGSGSDGQLGYGSTDDSGPITTDVELGASAISLSVGDVHTCAVLSGGGVRCWGGSVAGVLGQGNAEAIGDDEAPADAPLLDLPPARSIAVGREHSCALHEDGTVRCWGNAIFLGTKATENIGDDETLAATQPVQLGAKATEICAGFFHTCALTESGSVYCWGGDSPGPLGKGGALVGVSNTPEEAGPVELPGEATHVFCGFLSTCAELADGLYCWGEQNGTGDPDASAPAGPWLTSGVVDSAGGRDFQCAADTAGDVNCWSVRGSDLVAKSQANSAIQLDFGTKMRSLTGARTAVCGVTDQGTARCLGLAPEGVGDGKDIHVE